MSEVSSFCTFHVGDRLFGADILDIKEINTELEFTRISHAPNVVEGYVNIRGQINLILNLRKILNIEEVTENLAPKLVLFKESVGESFGILVDRVGDIIEVSHDSIEDRRKGEGSVNPKHERRAPNIGTGVCKLEDELLIILNAANLLKQISYQQED